MARWRVELLGDTPDTALLAALFTAPELRVLNDEGAFLLEAYALEDLQHHSDVLRIARDIVTRMNGATRLEHGSYRNVQVGPVHERRTDGRRTTTVFVEPATIDIRASVVPPKIEGGVMTEPVANPASRFVEIASRDQQVHEAVDLWADPQHNWMNLYKVFEIIRSRGATSLAGAKSKDLSRFTHTANHEKAGGRNARHARLGTDPPEGSHEPAGSGSIRRPSARVVAAVPFVGHGIPRPVFAGSLRTKAGIRSRPTLPIVIPRPYGDRDVQTRPNPAVPSAS